jgi:TIR domain
LQTGLGELPEDHLGVTELSLNNCDFVRERLEKYFNIGDRDAICFWSLEGIPTHQVDAMLFRHEQALGFAPMKIFLSHKGFKKPMVREFKTTLALLGFNPWLDEDAMPAGTNLQRGILKGFSDSCAAIFFVTAEFKDESYLATEVDYAINEKQTKKDRFSIITLVFGEGTTKGSVPDLLHRYVWKEPKSDLEALQEIIRALPILVGRLQWRATLAQSRR